VEKIDDLYTVDTFFVIELKNDKQKKIEINHLHKIVINVVKRKKIVPSVLLIGLLILDLVYIDSLNFKIALSLLFLFSFIAIYYLSDKQYTLIIVLKNKDKFTYLITSGKKLQMKEKVLQIRDFQYKHNFKE
jgi:hypothetical protein